ncbi:MAG: Eco57I restriction-modification methylase domain-containing protein, partial [Pirellulaceae bacterium]|nr:Eco57I restriction-modification methylase domain-containing protein [Pirellulaceae bacterium]
MSNEPGIRFSPARDEPRLKRSARRAQGVYYTPPEIVRWIVSRSLEVLIDKRLRVLDPSCGAGAFLLEAQAQIPGCSLHGVDLDPIAIATAKQALSPPLNLNLNVTLNPPPPLLRSADFLSPSYSPAPFDLILGNPPYINIRELAKSTTPAYRQDLRQRFQSARGNFDLYVLFLERSLELLRPGGVCGMIIPNKWAGLDYARPLRELLLAETTLHDIVDLSGVSVFAEAEVYPHILIFQKLPRARNHTVRVREVGSPEELFAPQSVRWMSQVLMSPKTISLQRTLVVESRVPTEPLGQRVRLHSGASGYTAGHMAQLLQEATEGYNQDSNSQLRPFIVSGNIDRYSIRLGNIRYMQRKLRQPLLDLNSDALSPLKKRLYAQPKIVIAGMFRRIEAAYDEHGLALGVQVYAAAEPLDDPYYLLAILNSRLMSFMFRERFAAKKLAGGYLALNKGQLEQLPIRVVDQAEEEDLACVARITELAKWGRVTAGPEKKKRQAGRQTHQG